jgi:Peptidase family M28
MTLDTSFAEHALSHARSLSASPRGSGTPAEKQAADYVQAQLNSLGIQQVKQEPFSGERSLWLFVALALGVALVGHAAYWLLRAPLGDIPAMLIAWLAFGFSGYLVWCRFTLMDYPLRTALPHAPSQNVIAVIPPLQAVRQRLVLVAHLDSHRAVFWFATDFLVRLFVPISILTILGIFLAIPVYGLAVLTHWQVFGWVGLLLALLHFIGWFTGVTADLGQYSPGANDNASSVGTLLALAQRMQAQPLNSTEVWLAFTGCEETSGDGIHAMIEEHGAALKEALFVDFEMVGIGNSVVYIHEEGNLRRLTIDPETEAFIKEVGQPFGLGPAETPLVGASTECSILWKHGYKAVCLLAHRQGSSIMPEWHRLTDTPSKLELPILERIHQLGWEILQRFDQRLA